MNLTEMGSDAKKAARGMARATTEQKNNALTQIIKILLKRQKEILEINQRDIDQAKADGLNDAMIDRLSLQNRLEAICADIQQVIKLPDPIGECFETQKRAQLNIRKCRTPIGVLGIIYESRPNVTIDISALAIKSSNCAILRGGSETLQTNKILVEIVQEALKLAELPPKVIQLISSTDRAEVKKMLRLHDYIDMIIPRGGASLHLFCRENSTIPVITGGIGICHLFVDESADLEKSLQVIDNAKTQRPTVCNALDTVLVHEKVADQFIPRLIDQLDAKKVIFKLDEKSWQIAKSNKSPGNYSQAGPEDWDTEWLSLVLGIHVVKDLNEAIEHICKHSTGHSDGILTQNTENAETFIAEVDSAAVYVNASTRFTDGAQLGLGAEVAISTQKLHARGPMGLKELTSYKWVISGDYTTRS
jgi:glutamate-5-semialdehyde dehydrogenase